MDVGFVGDIPSVSDIPQPPGEETHQVAAAALRQPFHESVRFAFVAQLTHSRPK